MIDAATWSELDRQNEIVIDGSPVLRFASLSVRLNEERVTDQLRRVRLAPHSAAMTALGNAELSADKSGARGRRTGRPPEGDRPVQGRSVTTRQR